jgi:hypothetical protein
MGIEIIGDEFAIEPELRAWMTQRLEKIASRFGPVDEVRIDIKRATAWSSVQWALAMRVRAYGTEIHAEVVADLDPKQFHIRNALDRIASWTSDPVLPVLTERPDLQAALTALEGHATEG